MAAYPSSFAILNAKTFPHLAKQVLSAIAFAFGKYLTNIYFTVL